MNLARVTGRIAASRRVAELDGHRLSLVQPIDELGRDEGVELVVVDHLVGAAAGDRVWIVNGYDAAEAFPSAVPVDAVIVGLVD